MRSLHVLIALAGAMLAASCAGSIYVSGRTSPQPSRPPAAEHHDDRAHAENHHRSVHPAHLGIPPGHLPPVGKCRVWLPGRPPGHQPDPGPCSKLSDLVPPGAWLVYRPRRDRKHVEVSVYDDRRPQVVVSVSVYDAGSGQFVREGKLTAAR